MIVVDYNGIVLCTNFLSLLPCQFHVASELCALSVVTSVPQCAAAFAVFSLMHAVARKDCTDTGQ